MTSLQMSETWGVLPILVICVYFGACLVELAVLGCTVYAMEVNRTRRIQARQAHQTRAVDDQVLTV